MTIKLYTSTVSGSIKVSKATEKIENILTAQKIEFEVIDVSRNEEAKNFLKENKPDPAQLGITLPQVWNGDKFAGDYTQIEDANEWGELKKVLMLE